MEYIENLRLQQQAEFLPDSVYASTDLQVLEWSTQVNKTGESQSRFWSNARLRLTYMIVWEAELKILQGQSECEMFSQIWLHYMSLFHP